MKTRTLNAAVAHRYPDVLVSLALFLLAFYVYQVSSSFSEIGAMFPRAVALMMGMLGVGLLLSVALPGRLSLRRPEFPRRSEGISDDDSGTDAEANAPPLAEPAATPVDHAESIPGYVVIGGLVAWVLLMPRIGFVLSSSIGLVMFSLAILGPSRWSRRNLVTLALIAACVPVLIHLVMKEYLLVPLP